MNILVTGAGGFIGSRLQTLKKESQDTFHFADRMDIPKDLSEVAAVIHLAGRPGGGWKDCMESNVLPTIQLLEIMESRNIPHLVFISTGSVYGNRSDVVTEDTELKPINAYGASKVAAEIIIQDWVTRRRIKSATILRGNNIYGPGSDHGVVALFANRIRNGEPIQVDGDGSQVREPAFVDDVIDIMIRAAHTHSEKVSIYNVSGPEFFTLKELASHIATALKKSLEIKSSGKDPEPPLIMRLDISKAKKDLDWQPRTRFDEGLAKTFQV